MKWSACLLLALAVLWLGWPRGGERKRGDEVVESSRRVRNHEERGGSERASALGTLESFAEGLSDEELWAELDLAFNDWLAAEGEWKGQPRLAIMLAREVGRRDGESGLKALVAWLKEREVEPQLIDGSFDMTRPFLHTRIRLGGYGGWVTRDPEQAIFRLIESCQKSESDWPVIDVGPQLGIRGYEASGVEEILRSGFARIAGNDLIRAKALLVEGARSEAFDVTQIAEAIFLRMSEAEVKGFRDELVLGMKEGGGDWQSKEFGIWEMEGPDDFFPMINLSLPAGVTAIWPPPGVQDFRVLVRARPELALEILRDGRASDRFKTDLVNRLALADRRHYGLIQAIPDGEKLEFVGTLFRKNWLDDFGPITGMDDPGAVNLEELRRAVEAATMADSVRDEIRDLLGAHRDSPD